MPCEGYIKSGVVENSLLFEDTAFYLQFRCPMNDIICAEFLSNVGHYFIEKQFGVKKAI